MTPRAQARITLEMRKLVCPSQGSWVLACWAQGLGTRPRALGPWAHGLWAPGLWAQGLWAQGLWEQGHVLLTHPWLEFRTCSLAPATCAGEPVHALIII